VLGYTPALSAATWRPGMRALLARQPWRELPVRVLNATGTTLCSPAGEHLGVRAMPAAVRELVARKGKVGVVGPDAKGRLVVRVDGLLTLWPARRIPPVDGTARYPTDEPIMAMWLRPMVARRQWVVSVVLAFIGVLELVLAVLADGDWRLLLFGAGFLSFAGARLAWLRRIRRLLPTTSWTRVEAAAPTWRVRWSGTADGTVTLTLPDGRTVTARLRHAPLDLVAAVRDEKALWLADDTTVGFPHYPLLARARLAGVGAVPVRRGT